MKRLIVILSSLMILYTVSSDDSNTSKKKSSHKRDITDMNDADLERILDEWEKHEEPLEPDELPEHLRPSPQIDLSKVDMTKPDEILRMTKKGKSLMMFIDVNPDISEENANVLMRIWQGSLQNNHIIAERYPIDLKRAVFLFPEGSQAIDAKNYLLEQPEISHITLEGQTFYGKHAKKSENAASEESNAKEPRKKLEL
ncbi:LDLR chaperone boca [Orussus abietinus]|uniref:LDLR chaperone boca n=1 Tax=Orussus abietinus TaxID=222816 RepID=UPI0006264417|nr:LDLR chaperone boca [Orussus abietinus]